MLRILKYIILLSAGCCCAGLFAQDPNAAETATQETAPVVYRGLLVEADAFSAVLSAVNRETYSLEAGVRANLLDKYFPAIEMGVAGADRVSVNGYGFKTNGFFARVGMDYNLLKPLPDDARIHRYFFVGLRYAFSPFVYDVTDIRVDNGYWGEGEVKNYMDVSTVKHWMEVVGGLHVEVFRHFYMGWGLRWKIQFGTDAAGEVSPWFVPGIGIKSIGNVSFNYTVGYMF